MPRKRYTPEEIVAKLRQVDVLAILVRSGGRRHRPRSSLRSRAAAADHASCGRQPNSQNENRPPPAAAPSRQWIKSTSPLIPQRSEPAAHNR